MQMINLTSFHEEQENLQLTSGDFLYRYFPQMGSEVQSQVCSTADGRQTPKTGHSN
jgi:hypothetical protein